MYYPLYLDLRHCRCLIVGAGRVGRRKLADLLLCNPEQILVVDPKVRAEDPGVCAGDPRVLLAARPFREEDLAGRRLAFAATSDAAVNLAVASACREHGVLCNCVDAPEESDFLVPARVCRGNLAVAISTQGASPALAKRLRLELESWLDSGFVPLAELLARLRPAVFALGMPSEQNGAVFRAVAFSDLPKALRCGDAVRCRDLLRRLLPPALHPQLTELLHGLV